MGHPDRWFAATSAVLFVLALVSRGWFPGDLDLQVHDTYFVLSPHTVFLGMAVSVAIFAATYHFLSVRIQAANWHFRITAVGVAVFWISFYRWGYVLMRHATAQANPRLEIGVGVAFLVSWLILLGSLVMFAINVLVTLLARLR
jgi:heme/copper-type cytochrome/quinol oxidase subunit 1